MHKLFYMGALGVMLIVPAALAQAKPGGDSAFTGATTDAVTTNGDQPLTKISTETGVPVSTLQAQKAQTGFGNGELRNANLLANASGQTFDQIAAERASGKGWGEIAKENNLKLGNVVSSATRSSNATTHARNTTTTTAATTHGKSATTHTTSVAHTNHASHAGGMGGGGMNRPAAFSGGSGMGGNGGGHGGGGGGGHGK